MILLLTNLLLAAPMSHAQDDAPAEPAEEAQAWEKTGWGWGGFPFVIYNTDDGAVGGLIGSVYKYNGETAPYKTKIGFLGTYSSKGNIYGYLDVDAVELAGGKLRLTTRLLFDSRFSEPFCGLGGDVGCDTALDEMNGLYVDWDNLSDVEPDLDQETALRRWYFAAYHHGYGQAWARYELAEMPHRVELIGGYRLSYYTPYHKYDPLYSTETGEQSVFPTRYENEDWYEQEKGFSSVLQAGIMADNRDNEPTPFRGYWVEATARGASKYWGSQFNWFGFNLTARGYLPILSEGRLTLADRAVFDGIVAGEDEHLNVAELEWFGGSQMGFSGVGGARSMRGVRSDRYRGKVKTLNQAELRWRFVRWQPGSTTVDFYLQGYLDAGFVAEEWEDLSSAKLRLGEGLGLRIAINQNFVLRADFATSALEDGLLTGLYLDVDNLW